MDAFSIHLMPGPMLSEKLQRIVSMVILQVRFHAGLANNRG